MSPNMNVVSSLILFIFNEYISGFLNFICFAGVCMTLAICYFDQANCNQQWDRFMYGNSVLEGLKLFPWLVAVLDGKHLPKWFAVLYLFHAAWLIYGWRVIFNLSICSELFVGYLRASKAWLMLGSYSTFTFLLNKLYSIYCYLFKGRKVEDEEGWEELNDIPLDSRASLQRDSVSRYY